MSPAFKKDEVTVGCAEHGLSLTNQITTFVLIPPTALLLKALKTNKALFVEKGRSPQSSVASHRRKSSKAVKAVSTACER